MKKISLILLLSVAIFASCGESQDVVKNVVKDGAIEVDLSTSHINDSFDVAKTHFVVYKKNRIVLDRYILDTIPSLGKDSMLVDSADKEFVKNFPLDYDFFVTLK